MTTHPTFNDHELLSFLEGLSDAELDALDFGVIGFDAEGIVRRYNAFESQTAGLSLSRLVAKRLCRCVQMQSVLVDDHVIAYTVSAGVAAMEPSVISVDGLLQRADQACMPPRRRDATGSLVGSLPWANKIEFLTPCLRASIRAKTGACFLIF